MNKRDNRNFFGGLILANNKLQFEEVQNIDTYHQDVKTYRVIDDSSNLVAVFYADFFPRAGKRNGAWMTSFKPQMIKNGVNERPHVSIVCNFTKPTSTKPSLLTFNEVTTLFHEFGHALHGMLANTTYNSLSGTSVSWDFVELPSQVLENGCYEKEALELFARHYKTNEVIPMEYVEKIKVSSLVGYGKPSVEVTGSAGIACFSLAQSPKSISRHRSLQNGLNADFSDHSTFCLHVGHLTILFIKVF